MELSDDEARDDDQGGRDLRNSGDEGGNRSDEAEEERSGRNEDDDAEGGKGRRVDPATSRKRVTRNPQPKLNAERIQGPKGVQTIEKYFEGFKFHGKGHEKNDLDRVMKRLEHWAHRLFPKYQFGDFLEKMESLGSKKNVQVFLKKYRLDMIRPDDDAVDPDAQIEDNEEEQPVLEEPPVDEFDKLIAEQIEKQRQIVNEPRKPTDSPAGRVLGSASTAKPSELTEDIKARIEANRKLALERKMARLRREEENKKKKLEASAVYSEVPDSTEVLNTNESDKITERVRIENSTMEDAAEQVVPGAMEMEVEDIHQEERNKSTEENTKDQGAQDLSEETILVPEVREEPQTVHEIVDEESCESPSSASFIREGDGTALALFDDPAFHPQEYNSYEGNSQDYVESNKEPEDLFTRDELLMEIEGAMEEIINKSNRRST